MTCSSPQYIRLYPPSAQERSTEASTHVVIVAVRTVLVALVILGHVLPERLLALLAEERHLRRLCQPVRLRLGVALGTVVPLPAAGCADGDLGVENVFADGATLSIRCCGRIVGTCHIVR